MKLKVYFLSCFAILILVSIRIEPSCAESPSSTFAIRYGYEKKTGESWYDATDKEKEEFIREYTKNKNIEAREEIRKQKEKQNKLRDRERLKRDKLKEQERRKRERDKIERQKHTQKQRERRDMKKKMDAQKKLMQQMRRKH